MEAPNPSVGHRTWSRSSDGTTREDNHKVTWCSTATRKGSTTGHGQSGWASQAVSCMRSTLHFLETTCVKATCTPRSTRCYARWAIRMLSR
jgi:hypothetical protein